MFEVLKNPEDYRNRAQIMWAGSLAHNDVTGNRMNGDWATHQIEGIEGYTVLDWMQCKEKPDYLCWNLCSARKACPNGVQPNFRKKKKDEYEGFGEES